MFPIQLPMKDIPQEECNESDAQAQSQAIYIKPEPLDVMTDGEHSAETQPQQPLQYQYVSIMPTVPTESVGYEWADQLISSDDEDFENEAQDADSRSGSD
jgi:hypothetical protein